MEFLSVHNGRFRLTILSALILVALIAVLMTLVRSIERMNHERQVHHYERQEKQWRAAHQEAIALKQTAAIANYEELADSCLSRRLEHEKQLVGFPRTFSEESALLAIFYIWAVSLVVVVRAERKEKGLTSRPDLWARSTWPSFFVWLRLGLISPITIMALGVFFERQRPSNGARPWPAPVIEALLWVQLIHALLGVVIFVGRRWVAFGIGILSILMIGWIALWCLMAVTGVWL